MARGRLDGGLIRLHDPVSKSGRALDDEGLRTRGIALQSEKQRSKDKRADRIAHNAELNEPYDLRLHVLRNYPYIYLKHYAYSSLNQSSTT